MPVKTPLLGDKQTWLDKNRNLFITIRQNIKGPGVLLGEVTKIQSRSQGDPENEVGLAKTS